MSIIADFLSDNQAIIGLILLVLVFSGFIFERYPPAVVAIGGAALFVVLGLLPMNDFVGVFSNAAPLTIGAMFILSGALVRTGLLEAAARIVLERASGRPMLAIIGVFSGAMVASAFVNNTPVVLVLIPIVIQLAVATKTSASKFLIPLSYAVILGGSCTLIGTSTNLLVDGVAQDQGLEPFGIFEISMIGLVGAVAGFVTMFILQFLLPEGRQMPGLEADNSGEGVLTDLIVRYNAKAVDQPINSVKELMPRGVTVKSIRRAGQLLKEKDGEEPVVLQPGDRLTVMATIDELLTLRTSKNFRIGISGRPFEGEEGIVIEAVVPASPGSSGRVIRALPLLSRLRINVLGVGRYGSSPGPDLESVRLKAGDRLVLEGTAEAIAEIGSGSDLVNVTQPAARPYRRRLAPIAIGAIAGVVILSALGVMSITALAIIAVAFILITRCLDAEEAWTTLDGDVLMLIFAMLAIGAGLEHAGSIEMLVSWIVPSISTAPPLVVLITVYFLTSILTETVTNNAVAVIVTPVAIALGQQLGMDPRVLVMAVMFGASASFATPIGYQTNTIVYAAGNYRFSDFLRIGVPMNITVGLAICGALAMSNSLL